MLEAYFEPNLYITKFDEIIFVRCSVNEIIYYFSCIEIVLVIYNISFNPFKPEFTIVIFIHYKPRIAVAILDL